MDSELGRPKTDTRKFSVFSGALEELWTARCHVAGPDWPTQVSRSMEWSVGAVDLAGGPCGNLLLTSATVLVHGRERGVYGRPERDTWQLAIGLVQWVRCPRGYVGRPGRSVVCGLVVCHVVASHWRCMGHMAASDLAGALHVHWEQRTRGPNTWGAGIGHVRVCQAAWQAVTARSRLAWRPGQWAPGMQAPGGAPPLVGATNPAD